MTRVFRSPAAERDLEDIWLTIAADNPTAATRWFVPSVNGSSDWHSTLGSDRAAQIFGRRPECWSRGRISFSLKRTPTQTRGRSTKLTSSASSTVGAT
jgi:hypothetical protein